MKASLQARVLALVGAGVFLAVALLSLLSRSSLLLLDSEVVRDHERLASSLARELSRAVGHDMRLLSGTGGIAGASLVEGLNDVRRHGRMTTAAFVVDAAGAMLACEPSHECSAADGAVVAAAAQQALASQRPHVDARRPDAAGRDRILVLLPFTHV